MSARTPWEAKVDRGREHLVGLQADIADRQSDGRLGITVVAAGPERILHLVAEEPDARLSTIIGDALHNFRSALDTIALALAEHFVNRTLSDEEERAVQFPIASTPKEFRDLATRQLSLLSPEQRVEIERFQAYYWTTALDETLGPPEGQRAADVAAQTAHEPLISLRDMSNMDKHRRLNLVTFFATDIGAGLPRDVVTSWRWARPAASRNGDEIGRWRVTSGKADTAFEHMGTVDLAFEIDRQRGWDRTVLDVLKGIEREVTNVCAHLAELL